MSKSNSGKELERSVTDMANCYKVFGQMRITKVVTMMVTKTKKTPPVVKLSSRRRACLKIMRNKGLDLWGY